MPLAPSIRRLTLRSRQVVQSTRLGRVFVAISSVAVSVGCTRQEPGVSGARETPGDHPVLPKGQEPSTLNGDVVSAIDQSIFVVFQATDGTRWFGSDGQGVYRHDGKGLVHFTTTHGLRGDRIRSIQEDRAGNILVSGEGGVSRFDGRTFQPLEAADGVWRLAPEDLWFTGWQDEGVVYRYDCRLLYRLTFPKTNPGEDHIAAYPRSKFPAMVFNPYDVYTIFKDSHGHVWFGTHVLGVCRYDGTSFAWAPKTELGFAEDDSFGLRAIVEDKDGMFWFSNTLHRFGVDEPAASGAGVASAERAGAFRLRKEPGVRERRDDFAFFMSSVRDKNGDVWFATLRSGVWRYDGTRMTQYPVKDGDAPVMLFSISKDNAGVLWLGTHAHGAYRFSDGAFEKVTF